MEKAEACFCWRVRGGLQVYCGMNFVFLLSLVSILGMYANVMFLESVWLGILIFFVYLLSTSLIWRVVYKKVFGFKRNNFIRAMYSVFTVFFLLSTFSAICVWSYKLTAEGVVAVFVGTSLVSWLAWVWARTSKGARRKNIIDVQIKNNDGENVLYPARFILILLYSFLWIITIILFIRSGGDQSVLQTPWQILSPYILPLMFVLTILLGVMLLSRFKTRGLLVLLITQTFLLHLYIPISHQLPWGGDVWRHIAVEKRLVEDESILPVLLGPEAVWKEVIGVDIPQVLVHPQKYSYGQLWGVTVLLTRVLHVDLLTLNIWLLPILWSLFFPILLFQIGTTLFHSKRIGLWLVWLSLVPFSLQAVGSLTLPVSLGLLGFLFVLSLWLMYIKTGNRAQKQWTLLLSFFLLFTYPLYVLLMWLAILVTGVVRRIERVKNKALSVSILIILLIFSIPIFELLFNTSVFPQQWSFISSTKQFIGQLTGWYYATGIRLHDVLSGNIFYNHTPTWSFVASPFTMWRWYVMPLMLVLWGTMLYGVYRALWVEKQLVLKVFGSLFVTVLGGYIIGWYILEGDRLLVRRLDPTLAVLMIIFLVYGCMQLVGRIDQVPQNRKILLIISSIILISFFATSNYASGPDMRVVSVDEYRVAEFVWNRTDRLADRHCVLADTWTLLALEAVSGRTIVGGGFPIDYQYGQVERESLLQELRDDRELASNEMIKELQEKTGAKHCFIVYDGLGRGDELFGDNSGTFGKLEVWVVGLN